MELITAIVKLPRILWNAPRHSPLGRVQYFFVTAQAYEPAVGLKHIVGFFNGYFSGSVER